LLCTEDLAVVVGKVGQKHMHQIELVIRILLLVFSTDLRMGVGVLIIWRLMHRKVVFNAFVDETGKNRAAGNLVDK
jgi:hypothetical protein